MQENMEFLDRMNDQSRIMRPAATNANLVELGVIGLYYFYLFTTGVMKLVLSMARPLFGKWIELVTKKPILQMVMTGVTELQNIGFKMIGSVGDLDKAIQDDASSSPDSTAEKTYGSDSSESSMTPEEMELEKMMAASQSMSVDASSIQHIVALTVDVTMKAAQKQFQNDLKAIIAKQMENSAQKKYNLNLQLMNVGAKC